MNAATIGARLRALREKQRLSQDEMAKRMGFNDRQTLSDLELGSRKVSAQDLVNAALALGTTVSFLTDPLQLVGEGEFSWRQKGVDLEQLDAFESKAGSWIAAYRYISQLKGDPVNSALRRLELTEKSSFEQAEAQGEAIAATLGLGDIPAHRLSSTLEDALDTLVLYVDTVPGISGAACQLGALNTILVNRKDPAARRHYDMAHELFHLLTWQTMPPARLDQAEGASKKYKRIEQLAESFGAGLLMPAITIDKLVVKNPLPAMAQLAGWLVSAAALMQVSPPALLWRLVNLGHVQKAAAERLVAGNFLGNQARETALADVPPLPFSKRFLGVLGWGIDQGHLSARRAATLLAMDVGALAELFELHGLSAPFHL